MKKFLSLVLALAMTLSLVTVSAGATDFKDDGDITYQEAVTVISGLGIVDGYSDGSFGPSGQLSADLVDRGLVLAGGGALIRNLNLRISDVTGLPCFVADDPLRAVANGTGIVLQNLKKKLDDGE